MAHYYLVEEGIVETRHKDHASLRRQLNEQLIGQLSVSELNLAPAVAEVQRKTGIRPPAWFNAGGVSVHDVNAIAVAQRAGR